jgi:DNA-binding response OmpR family regulator
VEKKLLVLDDDLDILKALSETFAIAGFTVVTAASGEKALEEVRKKYFPVMFVDLNLPGIDGVKFCKEVRKDNLLSSIFAMSGLGIAYGLEEIRKAGFDDYFIKPFNIKDLLKAAQYSFEKNERWEENKKDGRLSD